LLALALVERAIAELARHLRALRAVVPLLAVGEPQLHHRGRRLRAAAETAEDRGRAVEAIERLVRLRRLDERAGRGVAPAGAEVLLGARGQALDQRHAARRLAAGGGDAGRAARDRGRRRDVVRVLLRVRVGGRLRGRRLRLAQRALVARALLGGDLVHALG